MHINPRWTDDVSGSVRLVAGQAEEQGRLRADGGMGRILGGSLSLFVCMLQWSHTARDPQGRPSLFPSTFVHGFAGRKPVWLQ